MRIYRISAIASWITFDEASDEPEALDIVRDMPCVVEVGTVLSTLMRNQPNEVKFTAVTDIGGRCRI